MVPFSNRVKLNRLVCFLPKAKDRYQYTKITMDGLYEKGFDNLLMTEWKKAENEGVFNYKIAVSLFMVLISHDTT